MEKFDPAKKYGKLTVLLADLQFYLQMSEMTLDELTTKLQDKNVSIQPYNPVSPARVRLDESILWIERLTDVLIEKDFVDPNKLKEYFEATYKVEENETIN